MSGAVRRLPILRPTTRGECEESVRPCPWISCRYHLLTHVDSRGRLIAQGRKSIDGMTDEQVLALLDGLDETCALDVAEAVEPGEVCSFTEIGKALGVSDMTASRVFDRAMKKATAAAKELGLDLSLLLDEARGTGELKQ